MCKSDKNARSDIRELKQARFWDADGNWKWTGFTFNLPSHNYIHITKFIFSIRDKWYKNLGDDTVLPCKMFSSSCRPCLKNARTWAPYYFFSFF